MNVLPALLMSAAALASAADVTRVDFVAKTRLSPGAVSAWAPAFDSLFRDGAPVAGWPAPLRALAGLDYNDPRHADAFAPFAAELARAGLTPAAMAAEPAARRSQAAQAAALAAARGLSAGVGAAADRAAASLELGPAQALAATVELLRLEAAAGVYLGEAERARVGPIHRAALALQTEARAKRGLALLRADAQALGSADPVETALARDPSAAPAGPSRLLPFDAGRARKPEKEPELTLAPGQNRMAVLKGLSMGLSAEDAAALGWDDGAPRDDFFARYPEALRAAQASVKNAGHDPAKLYLGEARMPLSGAKENWSFTFYLLEDRRARAGHAVSVTFPSRKGKRFLVAGKPLAARLPDGLTPFALSSYNLPRAFELSARDAQRFLGEAVLGVEVGLSAVIRAFPEPISGDTDLWYVVSNAGREFGRVNARTRETRLPAEPPRASAPPEGWFEWLRGLVQDAVRLVERRP